MNNYYIKLYFLGILYPYNYLQNGIKKSTRT